MELIRVSAVRFEANRLVLDDQPLETLEGIVGARVQPDAIPPGPHFWDTGTPRLAFSGEARARAGYAGADQISSGPDTRAHLVVAFKSGGRAYVVTPAQVPWKAALGELFTYSSERNLQIFLHRVLELYPGVPCDGFIQALLTHQPLPAPIHSLHELILE